MDGDRKDYKCCTKLKTVGLKVTSPVTQERVRGGGVMVAVKSNKRKFFEDDYNQKNFFFLTSVILVTLARTKGMLKKMP